LKIPHKFHNLIIRSIDLQPLLMKENEILINTSRGAVIDEAALIEHCRTHPNFRAGLDVFEDEPKLKPGLDFEKYPNRKRNFQMREVP